MDNLKVAASEVNRKESQKAFAILMNGSALNQYTYDKGEPVSNPTFIELSKNYDKYYRDTYANMGFDLVYGNGFFYARDLKGGDFDTVNTGVRRIQGTLKLLARSVLESELVFSVLCTPNAGISKSDIDAYQASNEDVSLIMKACKIEQVDLSDAVQRQLIDRGIAFLNTEGRIVLTQAGISFFDDLFYERSDEGEADQQAQETHRSDELPA